MYASIRREPLDAISWQFDLTSAVVARLKAYLKTEDIGAALDDHFAGTWMPEPAIRAPVPEGCNRDAFGAVCAGRPLTAASATGAGTWAIRSTTRVSRATGFRTRSADRNRTRHITQARRDYPDHFLWMVGGSLFERGWALCGFENYLSYVAGEEEFVEEMTGKLADYCCKEMSLLKGTGLDAVRIGDDWGFQNALMVQPEVWRRIFKKHYQRVFRAAHDAGLVTMMHSCGKIEDIIPDLIEAGLDVLHPLQPESNNVVRCQREFGKDITFWGALGSQSTIPFGRPEDVRREVRDRLKLFGKGGYILAPAGAAPAETPAENILAIVDEARAQIR